MGPAAIDAPTDARGVDVRSRASGASGASSGGSPSGPLARAVQRTRRALVRPDQLCPRHEPGFRVVAILAAYNEERFMDACLSHYASQGVSVYLVDNESTDGTVAIAERYRDRCVIGIETLARGEWHSLDRQLEHKAALAWRLDADWLIHADPDEIRLPPRPDVTLAEALAEADERGYTAVNFQEYTFVPTQEEPDHDHPRFLETMRWYYPFAPSFPHRVNAWKRPRRKVDLVGSGGHRVRFRGLRLCPETFPMRHYIVLSYEHALAKYVQMTYDPAELARGRNRARASIRADDIDFPPQKELRLYEGDERLDPSQPRSRHPIFAVAQAVA